jgi:hypothetical protein
MGRYFRFPLVKLTDGHFLSGAGKVNASDAVRFGSSGTSLSNDCTTHAEGIGELHFPVVE